MIPLKTPHAIEIMRRNGRILGKILSILKKHSIVDMPTAALDKLASELIFNYNAKPSFKGYQKYPKALCVSLNEEVVHALPKERKIRPGDIVSLDLGIEKDGYHVDAALTFGIEPIPPKAKKLILTTQKALKLVIEKLGPDKKVGFIGETIQHYVEKRGYHVIRDLTGHGIGKKLHEPPRILNFGKAQEGQILKPGMTLAIEPMASLGSKHTKKGPDGFAYITTDNSLSAHFEATVAITNRGVEVLTPGII